MSATTRTVLATVSCPVPSSGQFLVASVSFTSDGTDAGENLRVEFLTQETGDTAHLMIDNVWLRAN